MLLVELPKINIQMTGILVPVHAMKAYGVVEVKPEHEMGMSGE